MNSPYTDTENALLCDYFNIIRPEHLRGVDVFKCDGGMFVIDDRESPEIELARAVGRIALNGHSGFHLHEEQALQPQRKNGEFEALIPRHLFSIRWAEAYLDCVWTESYYMTFFPGFDRYVVTAIQSPNELFDLEEIAIGWRTIGLPRLELAEDIVTHSWKELHSKIISRAWQSVERAGLVSEDCACMWRNRVWRLLLN